MTKNVVPNAPFTFLAFAHPALPARSWFHCETLDQYATKHIVLFLINLGIDFRMDKSPDDKWNLAFVVPEDRVPVIECLLNATPGSVGTIPCSRPSSDEFLIPHKYANADAGRLDLEQSRNAVAQVASQADTQYLADLWNAFAPGRKPETVDASLAPVPCQPVSDVALTVLQTA